MIQFNVTRRHAAAAAMLSAVLVISGCGSDSDSDSSTDGFAGCEAGAACAIVASVPATGDSAQVKLLDSAAPYMSVDGAVSTTSDYIVRTNGDNYYVLARFQTDSITGYSISDPQTALFQFSVNDAEETDVLSANPYDLVFASDQKAYLIRYGSPKIWIVDPSATTLEDFRIGTLDLSGYDSVGAPQASGAAIVDGKLFVMMQRLGGDDGFRAIENGYVAVFDTSTDQEIDTGTGGSLMGIELPIINPNDMSVDPVTGDLFIAGVGAYAAFDGSRPAELTGGVAMVNTADYSTQLLVDDDAVGAQVSAAEVISADAGYLISYAAYQSNTLVRFNPNTGAIEETGVAGLSDVDLRDVARGPDGTLWVGVGDTTNPRIVIIDPADNSVVSDSVNIGSNPNNIVFANN